MRLWQQPLEAAAHPVGPAVSTYSKPLAVGVFRAFYVGLTALTLWVPYTQPFGLGWYVTRRWRSTTPSLDSAKLSLNAAKLLLHNKRNRGCLHAL